MTPTQADRNVEVAVRDMDSAPVGVMVWLLYAFPDGDKEVQGVFRSGRFWGREVKGWWSGYAPQPRRYGFDVNNPGMWVDGWIKGWRPLDDTDTLCCNWNISADAARRETLEEAAKVAESFPFSDSVAIAHRIRALIDKEPSE